MVAGLTGTPTWGPFFIFHWAPFPPNLFLGCSSRGLRGQYSCSHYHDFNLNLSHPCLGHKDTIFSTNVTFGTRARTGLFPCIAFQWVCNFASWKPLADFNKRSPKPHKPNTNKHILGLQLPACARPLTGLQAWLGPSCPWSQLLAGLWCCN